MADEKLVAWLKGIGVTAFDSTNSDAPADDKAQSGVDAVKVSAPTATGSSPSTLIKQKPTEPPPEAGISAEGKRGTAVNSVERSLTASVEGKIAGNDGRGGIGELGGKGSVKVDASHNIEASLGANVKDLDAKGKGTQGSGQITYKRDAARGQNNVGLSGDRIISDDEGNEKKVSGGISTSGVQGGFSRTDRIGEEYGKSVSGNAAVDWRNKEASAGIERKQQFAGDKATSMGADVKGKLGQDGGAEGTLGASAGRGDWKAGASITLQSIWTVTKEPSGKFLVEYIGGVKGGLTTTGQKGKESKGAVTGSASGGHQAFFQRRFDSEADARDFCKKNTSPPASGADVDPSKLQAGDKAGTMDSLGVGAGGTANVEGVQIGATLNWGTSAVVEVTKIPDKKPTVEVKYFDLDQIAAGGSFGAGGLSMGVDVSKQKFEFQVVRFKLDSPEGVAAFNSFRKNGKLPQGKGWEVVSKGKGTNDKLQKSIGLFTGTIKMSNSTSSSEETDAAGNRIRTETGTDEVDAEFKPFGDEIKLPGGVSLNTKWLTDWHKEKHSLNIRVVNDQPTFVLNSSVDSKGARGAGRVLANITNSADGAAMETGASAGAWAAEMPVSLPDMQKFTDRVLAGDGEKNLAALGPSGLNDLKTLKSSLKKADKQGDEWFKALTEFFSKTGDRGIRFLEVLIGKQKMEISLDPAADKEHAWLRIEDFEDLARRLNTIEKNVAAGKVDEATRVDLADIKAGLRKKADLVTNDRRYTEVPQKVKKDYAEKLKKLLVRFQDLQPRVDKALDQKKGLSAEAQQQIAQGQKLFAALESAFNGVDKLKTFVKETRIYVDRQTSGDPMTRFRNPIKAAIDEADNALADYASERELSERGVAELKANPCKEAFANLSGAVEDGRKKLQTALAGYRKAFETMQSFRDYLWSDYNDRGMTKYTFSLEDFPKTAPLLPAADFAFLQNGTVK